MILHSFQILKTDCKTISSQHKDAQISDVENKNILHEGFGKQSQHDISEKHQPQNTQISIIYPHVDFLEVLSTVEIS